MNLPKRITKARIAAGLSQADLAAKLGISAGTVGGWETGRHRVRVSRIAKLAAVLDVSVAELMRLLPLPLKRRRAP